MFYHVVRHPPHNYTDLSTTSKHPSRTGAAPKLMPRYHYSRIAPSSATASESFFPRHHLAEQSTKPIMTATTTTSNNNHYNPYSYASFQSTFIPLVTNNRTMTPNKRESIQIPITRENETTNTDNSLRTVPIHFLNATPSSPQTTLNNSANANSKPHFTSFLRPSSKYFQQHFNNNVEEPANSTATTSLPHLPSVPVRTTATNITITSPSNEETIKQTVPPSPSMRSIPIRFPQSSTVSSSIPNNNNSRTTSALLRSIPKPNTELAAATSPTRRAEVMAREAIQGVVRFQEQQQQGNNSIFDTNNHQIFMRSPSLSRRVIINLRNNQSVSLDSRLLSANPLSLKPPVGLSASRITQRNNLYHNPVVHDTQMPSHPATLAAESPPPPPLSASPSTSNPSSYKNEFRMEIPVTLITNNDQENSTQQDEIPDDEEQTVMITDRLLSANPNSNPTLKSILKRSSSRETMPRKNVSFINV